MPKELKAQNQTKLQRKGEAYMAIAENLVQNQEAAIVEFRKLQQKMNALNGYIAELNENDTVLQEAHFAQLKKDYLEVLESCDALMQASLGKKGKMSNFYKTIKKIAGLVQQDMTRLDQFRQERGMTLEEFLQSSVTETVDLNDLPPENLVTMQGQTSERIPMNVVLKTGGEENTVTAKGLFTKEKFSASTGVIIKDYGKKHPAFARAIKSIPAGYKDDDNVGGIVGLLIFTLKEDGEYGVQFPDNFTETRELMDWYRKTFQTEDREACKELKRLFSEIQPKVAAHMSEPNAGIKPGHRVDQRNCAMYAVAELLGKPELIAKAVPMDIKKDGQTVHGTFMEFAKGEDARNITENNSFATMEYEDQVKKSTTLIEQAANLQVLDFICGNIDRHGGNIFYQFDEKRENIIGIQGIDNDLTFGILDQDFLINGSYGINFASLNNMRFITQEMYEKIQNLDRSQLKIVLSRFALSDQEINAACDRLDLLKNSLVDLTKEEFRVLKRPEKNKHELYVLSSEQIKQLEINSYLLPKQAAKQEDERNNIFSQMQDELTAAKEEAERAERAKQGIRIPQYTGPLDTITKNTEKQSQIPTIDITRNVKNFNPADTVRKLDAQIQKLNKLNKGAFVSSTEFDNVMEYMKIVRERFSVMENKQEDYKNACSMLENLDGLCAVYIDKKRAEKDISTNKRSYDRMLAVQDLKDSVKNSREKLEENDREYYGRLSTLQRTGAFNTQVDTKTVKTKIAAIKAAMKQAAKHGGVENAADQINAQDGNLTNLFDTITVKNRVQMLHNYAVEGARLVNILQPGNEDLMVPAEKWYRKGLKEISHLIKVEDGIATADSDAMKKATEALQKLCEKTEAKVNEQKQNDVVNADGSLYIMQICSYRMQSLLQKAKDGYVSPADPKEMLMERLLLLEAKNGMAVADFQYLENYDTFMNKWNGIKDSVVFERMTYGKSEKQLKEMLKENDAKFMNRYKDAAAGKFSNNTPEWKKVKLESLTR